MGELPDNDPAGLGYYPHPFQKVQAVLCGTDGVAEARVINVAGTSDF